MLHVGRTSRSVNLFKHHAHPGSFDVSRYFAPAAASNRCCLNVVSLELQSFRRFQSTEPQARSSQNVSNASNKNAGLPGFGSVSGAVKPPSSGTEGEATSETKGETSSRKAESEGKGKTQTSKEASASSEKAVSKPQAPLTTRIWAKVKHEAQHYWAGTKLLGKEIKISARLQLKLLKGKSLTRREKRQLKRTTQDLLRLIPFIPFVVIPFMELLLPVALKVFPNMLPSTFEDKHAADEKKRKLLKVRLEMAKFLQETIRESGLAKNKDKLRDSDDFKKFFRKVRSTGEQPTTEEIIKVARLFEDDLTLDNLSRPQLVSMCRYMNINAFGTDNFLRYTVRSRLAQLGKDDQLIDAEGVDALSAAEIAHACASRGIRTASTDAERQKAELAQWIDLHLHHNLSGVLLVLAKVFAFTEKPDGTIDHLESIKTTLSSLPDSLVDEVELSVSGSESDEGFKQRLEVLQQQEELIEDEEEQEQEEEEARKARKAAELEEKEQAARQAEQADAAKEKESFEETKELAKEMLPDDLAHLAKEPTPEVKDVKMTKEQLAELGEALFVLSAKSSVARERAELSELMKDSAESDTTALAEGEERKPSSLEKRVKNMLAELDEQLSAYDAEVSHKMKRFEVPEDGKISIQNLRTAFEQINHRPDDDSITALIDKLDVDHDGFVPIEDVTSLAEVEGIGVVLDEPGGQLLERTQEMKADEGLQIKKGSSTPSKDSEESQSKKLKREEIVE